MHLTSVDPPEVLRFVRDHYPDVIREKPETTMWRLIPQERMPPTRLARYCCSELKERKGSGRIVVTGIRWEESAQRSGRRMVESCIKDGTKSFVHPIIDWTRADVWEFLNSNNIPHCCLYDEGFTRIGCIGCPMGSAKQREKQFARWPRFKEMYMRAFAECVRVRNERGLKSTDEFSSAESMFDWWMSEHVKVDSEPGLFDFNEDDD